MKEFRYGILPFILILAPAAGLLVLQSHLSATIIVCLLVFSMMLLGGSSLAWLGGAAGLAAGAAFAVLKLPFVQELPLFKEKLSHIFQRLAIWEDPVAMIANKATRSRCLPFRRAVSGDWASEKATKSMASCPSRRTITFSPFSARSLDSSARWA